MTKRIIAAVLFLLGIAFALPVRAGTTVHVLEGLNKPDMQLVLDKDNLYLTEKTSVLIYSLKDYKLKAKFGKSGEGPQEFMNNPQFPLDIFLDGSNLMIGSFGKVSWWTTAGEFKTEIKLKNPFYFSIRPFGENYVATKMTMGDKRYMHLIILDKEMNEIKELRKILHSFQPGKGLNLLSSQPRQAVSDSELLIAWENDMIIDMMDVNYNIVKTITHKLERLKVTDDVKNRLIDFLKTSPNTKDVFEMMKPITFPGYMPAVLSMICTGSKIYVATYKMIADGKDCQFLVFDAKGKFIREITLPVTMSTPLLPHPFTIFEGKLYQVVEDEKAEVWNLEITDF